MAAVRIHTRFEVHQRGNALLIERTVPALMVYDRGQWHCECREPPFTTAPCESFEEALIEGARQAERELQARVEDRPMIAGKITPDMVRAHFP